MVKVCKSLAKLLVHYCILLTRNFCGENFLLCINLHLGFNIFCSYWPVDYMVHMVFTVSI